MSSDTPLQTPSPPPSPLSRALRAARSPRELRTRLRGALRPPVQRARRRDLLQTLLSFPEHDAATVATLLQQYGGDREKVAEKLREVRSPERDRWSEGLAEAWREDARISPGGDESRTLRREEKTREERTEKKRVRKRAGSEDSITSLGRSETSARESEFSLKESESSLTSLERKTRGTKRQRSFVNSTERKERAEARERTDRQTSFSTAGRESEYSRQASFTSFGRHGSFSAGGARTFSGDVAERTFTGGIGEGAFSAGLGERAFSAGFGERPFSAGVGGRTFSAGESSFSVGADGRTFRMGAGVNVVERRKAGWGEGDGLDDLGEVVEDGILPVAAADVRRRYRKDDVDVWDGNYIGRIYKLTERVGKLEEMLQAFLKESERGRQEMRRRMESGEMERLGLERRHETLERELEENQKRGVKMEEYLDRMRRDLVRAVADRQSRLGGVARAALHGVLYYLLAYLVPVLAATVGAGRDFVAWCRRRRK